MIKVRFLSLLVLGILGLASVVSANDAETDESTPPIHEEAKAEADRVISNLPNNFFIVGTKDSCPKDITNLDGSLNNKALDCNSPYSFKALPKEVQRDIILKMNDTDWGNYNESTDRLGNSFNVNLRKPDANLGVSLKEKFDSYSKGCRPKKFRGNGFGIWCNFKF